MKKLIISAVVVVGAIFGAYTANQTGKDIEMTLMGMADIEADAAPGECGSTVSTGYYPLSANPQKVGEISVKVTISAEAYIEFQKQTAAGVGVGPLMEWLNLSGNISSSNKRGRKSINTVEVTITESVYEYSCVGSEGKACTPYRTNQ